MSIDQAQTPDEELAFQADQYARLEGFEYLPEEAKDALYSGSRWEADYYPDPSTAILFIEKSEDGQWHKVNYALGIAVENGCIYTEIWSSTDGDPYERHESIDWLDQYYDEQMEHYAIDASMLSESLYCDYVIDNGEDPLGIFYVERFHQPAAQRWRVSFHNGDRGPVFVQAQRAQRLYMGNNAPKFLRHFLGADRDNYAAYPRILPGGDPVSWESLRSLIENCEQLVQIHRSSDENEIAATFRIIPDPVPLSPTVVTRELRKLARPRRFHLEKEIRRNES